MLRPNDESELSEAIAGAKKPLSICGGGTRPIGHRVEAQKLTTRELSGITLYEPGALTIVAKAGTPVAEIEAALEAEGQMLAFEPMDHRALLGTIGEPTIGGVVAGNVSGPRRVQAGACRDFLLGVRFVDGRGDIVKSGGRVMKNVTGYDLVKLMAGSRGTLGVVSEVSLKVLPKPDTSATLVYLGCGWSETTAIFTCAMTSPFEVSAASRLPAGTIDEQGAVIVRVEGFQASVNYRAQELAKRIEGVVGPPVRVVSDGSESNQIWCQVRDATPFVGTETDIWRLSIKPTDLEALHPITSEEDAVVDWGGGLVWLRANSETNVRASLEVVGGHATLVRGSDETKSKFGVFQPEAAPLAELSKGLRDKFDPRGILNPGLMG